MLIQDFSDLTLQRRLYFVKDNVAVRGQSDRQSKFLRNFAESAPPPSLFRILYSPLLDPDAAEQFPVALLVPTQQIAYGIPGYFFGRLHRNLHAFAHLVAEPADSAFVNQILKASLLAVGAIAKITLSCDNGYSCLHSMLTCDVEQGLGKGRKCFSLAV